MNPTPLELLLDGRYQELLARMRNPVVRNRLIAEVAWRYGNVNTVDKPAEYAERQHNLLASGDWSWGLLTAPQRREFLIRDTGLVLGSGRPDKGTAQKAALRRLRGELSNLYDTLQVALQSGDLDWLLPLAEHLADVLDAGGQAREMHERYVTLVAAAQRLGSPALELHARLGLSLAQQRLGQLAEAAEQAALATTLAEQERSDVLRAVALHLHGTAQAMAGNYIEARGSLGQALELRRKLGVRHGVVATASNLAYVEQCQGDTAAAQALLEQALSDCRALGDRRGEAMFLQNLGALAFGTGDYARARALANDALAAYHEVGDQAGVVAATAAAGFAAYGSEDLAQATVLLAEAHRQSVALEDSHSQTLVLLTLGSIALLAGDTVLANQRYTAALELAGASGDQQSAARALCGLTNAAQPNDSVVAAGHLAEALIIFSAAGEQPALADCLLYGAALLARTAATHQNRTAVYATVAELLSKAKYHAVRLGHDFDPLDRQLLRKVEGHLCSTVKVDITAAEGTEILCDADALQRELALIIA